MEKKRCRYCQNPLNEPFLDLGAMAPANSFLTQNELKNKEFTCPLSLVGCSKCGLVQLSHVVPPERMFSNYLYVSSTTQTFRKHFSEYARDTREKLGITAPSPPPSPQRGEGKGRDYSPLPQRGRGQGEGVLAVDIGSNDGLLLSCYQNEGMKAVGVEPAKNLSEEANRNGLPTLNDYFGEATVREILEKWGPADIVSANNVFAHVDDIRSFCENVGRLLAAHGIFVIEFPYLVTMIEDTLFDMIYHEHLSYIAVKPLQALLAGFEFEIFEIEKVASHGGSLRVFVQKKGAGRPVSKEVSKFVQYETQKGYDTLPLHQEFAKRVYRVRDELKGFVGKIKSQKESLSGYGAAAKGNTLINFCGFNANQIDFLVDDNPLKQNLFTPGAHIPVVSSRRLFENPTDYVVLFAWNFAGEIIKKLDPLKKNGAKFIVPLPQPRIVEFQPL